MHKLNYIKFCRYKLRTQRNTRFMKEITTIIFTVLLGLSPISETKQIDTYQKCSAELTVEKNRHFQSANEDGAEFKLTLKNTSNATATYNVSASMLSSPCANTKNKNIIAAKNSDLDVTFNSDSSNNSIGLAQKNLNTITLAPGESKEFIVNIMAIEGTKYNSWGCVEVKATSINCKNTAAKIVLSVYVPDPSEE